MKTGKLSKDSATIEVVGEHKGLVHMLIEQNKRTVELLVKQQAEKITLISKLEITTHLSTNIFDEIIERRNTF